MSHITPGYSAEAAAVSLFKLLGDIDLIIEDLKVAIADPAANYGFTPRYNVIAVEAFWQQMITSACNYNIGTKGLKAFSDATRLIKRPYYQPFSTIMGHTFGKYEAGRGAN